MNTDIELKVQAYLDNELNPGEARKIAALISSDSEARELYNALKETKEIIATNEPVVRIDCSRDFYWSQIQRRITAEEKSASAAPARQASPWWMRLLAPVAGAVGLFAVLLSVSSPGPNPPIGDTASTARAPFQVIEKNPDVSTITFRSEAEGVTVVWVSH